MVSRCVVDGPGTDAVDADAGEARIQDKLDDAGGMGLPAGRSEYNADASVSQLTYQSRYKYLDGTYLIYKTKLKSQN